MELRRHHYLTLIISLVFQNWLTVIWQHNTSCQRQQAEDILSLKEEKKLFWKGEWGREKLKYHIRRFNIHIVGDPERDTRKNETAQKIIQKNFQELKDELPNELSTRSGIKMVLDFNKNKWRLEDSKTKLSKFWEIITSNLQLS